jgi:streptogramin lyase
MMKRVVVGVSILFALALLVGSFGPVLAADPVRLVTEYPLPGSPYRVAVEGAGRVWGTLPARNTIGHLVVAASGTPVFQEFELPTAGSHPYDIAYAAGSIWVSEYIGNKIARFDLLAGTWTEYPIPTQDSKPTGLTVLAGDPIQVWFCEQAGNKLGLLTITATGTSQFAEFPLPLAWSHAELENVAATSSENVWFTAPGRSGIGQFLLSL